MHIRVPTEIPQVGTSRHTSASIVEVKKKLLPAFMQVTGLARSTSADRVLWYRPSPAVSGRSRVRATFGALFMALSWAFVGIACRSCGFVRKAVFSGPLAAASWPWSPAFGPLAWGLVASP
jgi:hypothetical protein